MRKRIAQEIKEILSSKYKQEDKISGFIFELTQRDAVIK